MARLKGDTDLHQLIHSLTPEEKGYYKKFAKRFSEKGSELLRLFEALEQQNVFDEKSLKKKFKSLAVLKAQLFEQVMQSLLIVSEPKTPEEKFLRMYFYIEQVDSRGLLKRAITLNKKALESALAAEAFTAVERLAKQKHTLLVKDFKSPEESIVLTNQIYDLIDHCYKKKTTLDFYHKCFQTMMFYQHSKRDVTDEKVAIRDLPILKELKPMLKVKHSTASETRFQFNAAAKFYELTCDFGSFLKSAEQNAAFEKKLLADGSPMAKEETVLSSANALVYAHLRMNRFAEAEHFNEEIQSLEFRNQRARLLANFNYISNAYLISYLSKNYLKGYVYYNQFKAKMSGIDVHHSLIGKTFSFIKVHEVGFVWVAGEFREAFKLIHNAEDLIIEHQNRFLIHWLELAKVLIHLDAENYSHAQKEAMQLLNANLNFNEAVAALLTEISKRKFTARKDALAFVWQFMENHQGAFPNANGFTIHQIITERMKTI